MAKKIIRETGKLTESTYAFSLTHHLLNRANTTSNEWLLPFIPTLRAELALGFDLALTNNCYSLFLQFKISDEIISTVFNKQWSSFNSILREPGFRFQLNIEQNQRLVINKRKLQNVYYAAPLFTEQEQFREYFFSSGQLIEQTAFIAPEHIPQEKSVPEIELFISDYNDTNSLKDGLSSLNKTPTELHGIDAKDAKLKSHWIYYDTVRAYMCSEPIALQEFATGKEIFTKLRTNNVQPVDYLSYLFDEYVTKANEPYIELYNEIQRFVKYGPEWFFVPSRFSRIFESAIQFVVLRQLFRHQYNLEFYMFADLENR